MFPHIGVGCGISRTLLSTMPQLLSKPRCVFLILSVNQGSVNSAHGSYLAKNGFCFSKCLEKIKKYIYYFVTHDNIKLKFQCPQINFHQNTVILIHLHIILGYFCSTIVDLINCKRASKAHKLTGPLHENLLAPQLDHQVYCCMFGKRFRKTQNSGYFGPAEQNQVDQHSLTPRPFQLTTPIALPSLRFKPQTGGRHKSLNI